MKSRGFTLAELLGVIAILGVIALITVPAINRSLDSGREDLYKTQIEQIKKVARIIILSTWTRCQLELVIRLVRQLRF